MAYDTPDEAALGAICQEKFGAGVIDELVTNWLQGHAENFRRVQVATIVAAAKTNATVRSSVETLTTAAETELAAQAAAAAEAKIDGK